MQFQPQWHAATIAVGATYTLSTTARVVVNFACTVSGTMTITTRLGTAKLTAFPVTAGVVYDFGFIVGEGATVALTSAAGTVGVY